MSAESTVALQPIQAPDGWVIDREALERTRQQAVEEKLQRLQTLKPVSQFNPQDELDLAKENFDRVDRKKGQLVSQLSASINGRFRSEHLKDWALEKLGNPENGFNYGGNRVFIDVVAQLENQQAHRAPLAASLARAMKPRLIRTFASFQPSIRQSLISAG